MQNTGLLRPVLHPSPERNTALLRTHEDYFTTRIIEPRTGARNGTVASCYCGTVKLRLAPPQDGPMGAFFCHCKSCQLVFGAPVSQTVWLKPDSVQICQGAESLTHRTDGTDEAGFRQGGYSWFRRRFCRHCSTHIMNEVTDKKAFAITIVFPATFEDPIREFTAAWQPRRHLHCDEAVLDLDQWSDGLPRNPAGL